MLATASNLASPVIVGTIVESLAGQMPLEVYRKVRQGHNIGEGRGNGGQGS